MSVVLTWAGRVLAAAYIALGAGGAALWIAGAIREHLDFRRASREISQALALVCRPCNDEEGPCTCGRKLPGPDRPQPSGVGTGDDTGVMTIDDEYRALLDKEAGR
jgi:hypothetical protein